MHMTHGTQNSPDGPNSHGVRNSPRRPLENSRSCESVKFSQALLNTTTYNILDRRATGRERRATDEAGKEPEEEQAAHIGRKYDGQLKECEGEHAHNVAGSPPSDGKRLHAEGKQRSLGQCLRSIKDGERLNACVLTERERAGQPRSLEDGYVHG
jgi:hypothetical protein